MPPSSPRRGCVLGPLCGDASRSNRHQTMASGECSRRSTPVHWAWLDLNQRPHPYQVSRAQRCADRRFPRSPTSVRGEGMRSNNLVRTGHGHVAGAAGKVCQQPVAGKVMGLPGGAAALSSGLTVTVSGCVPDSGSAAGPSGTQYGQPPDSARAAASPLSDARSQPGCPLGSAGRTGALVGWSTRTSPPRTICAPPCWLSIQPAPPKQPDPHSFALLAGSAGGCS